MALRPRGRAAGGPCEAQEAHRTQTRGRRPHVSTRPRGRPCGVPRGRWGVSIWRAHGILGPGKIVGAVTRKHYTAPIFILDFARFFFHVGLCSHTFFFLQATWPHDWRWMRSDDGDRVDPSPRDHQCSMCRNIA